QRDFDAVADFDFASAARARDLEADHGFAVENRGGALFAHRVADLGDLVQTDAAAVREWNLHGGEFVGRLHRAQRAYRLFGVADVGAAARGFALHLAQLARDIGGGGVERLQTHRVQLDTDFARDAADAGHRTHALDVEHTAR